MNVIGFKAANCQHCYKCVRTCDVKAITIRNEQAHIMNDQCILCGQCLDACPQNAKTLISDLEQVKQYIKSGAVTIVSLAPSYLGVLKHTSPGQVITALKKLGFTYVRETAEGAALVTKEYERLLSEGNMENILTTSCPSVNDLIEIYYPSLVPYMAPVDSPMIAHGKLLRKAFPNAKIVFLGPCIAKKREAFGDNRTCGYIDAVLNFREFELWLAEEGIVLSELPDSLPDNQNPEVNRLYPISSGVLSSVIASKQIPHDSYRKFYVHGIKNCMDLFRSMERGEITNSFIELNLCTGGCIKGPAINRDAISRFKVKLDMEEAIPKTPVSKEYPDALPAVSLAHAFFDRSPKDAMPTEEQIAHILRKLGKTKPEHMLNCGACGYANCREKAIAVYRGKAELTMCIPYMHDRAQSLSNVVLDTSPNMIVIVDSELKIIEFSKAAEKHFHLSRARAREKYLYELIDPSDFLQVLETHEDILSKKVVYEDTGLATMQNIVYMKAQNSVLGIFQDITKEEEQNKLAYKVKIETIEMAQRVIDKQMLVAQEIAGLLGETTAETKVTLTKLRDTILYDGSAPKPQK